MTDTPDFGDKVFPGVGFPTPVFIPDITACRSIPIPADGSWEALVMGMLLAGIYPENWQQMEGGISREDAANRWQQMIDETYDFQACEVVPAPFWDEGSGDDSDDTAPAESQEWYGQLVLIDDRLTFVENAFIYTIAGFIAYAGLPTAAISFVPIARNFVVTMKTNPLGGIVRFLADGSEIGRVDTYSASDGVLSAPVSMPAPTMSIMALTTSYPTLWVELLEDNPHFLPSVSMTLIRSRLSESDFSNPDYRYDADCDCIQYTPDGGSTWVDAPGNDPRHAPQFLKPPVAGSSKQCDAAANMVKWLKDFIDEVTALMVGGALVTSIVNKLLEFIDLLFPGADLLTLILEAAGTIFDIGAAALTTAFTTHEYDLLLCIFYCNDAPDGQVTPAQLTRIESQITAQLNTTAALVVNLILFVQGENGLSNAGSIGTQIGDCSACTSCFTAYEWNFRITDGLFVFDPEAGITGGVYVGGTTHGYEKASTGVSDPPYDCGRKSPTFDIPAGCHINTLTLTLDPSTGGLDDHLEAYIGTSRSSGLGQNPHIYGGTWGATVVASGDISNQSGVHVTFQFAGNDAAGDFYSIRIDWSGDEPIGLSGGAFVT